MQELAIVWCRSCELSSSEQYQEQDECVDDTVVVYTGENMGFKESKERGGGRGRGEAHTSLIISFLSIFLFFMNCHCQNNSTHEMNYGTEIESI